MDLRNKTRAELEAVTPQVLEETEEYVKVRCLDTFDLYALRSDKSVTPCLVNDGYWEAWITAWFTRNVSEGDYVLDVGANCGYYSMLFKSLGADVLAFECNLEYVVALHKSDPYLAVIPKALSDRDGWLDLSYPGEYTGSASVMTAGFDQFWGKVTTQKVETTTLDTVFDSTDVVPNLIKMDAEGAEELILAGATEMLSKPDAPVLVIEYSPGLYSDTFPQFLFDYGHVTAIDFAGGEKSISKEELETLTDWEMLVIRKK